MIPGTPNLAHAIYKAFISPNEVDRNLEPANVVDGLFAVARAIDRLAVAIERSQGPAGRDCLPGRQPGLGHNNR